MKLYMKLYMVIVEACMDGYGTCTMCLGIFDNRDDAEKACEDYKLVVKQYLLSQTLYVERYESGISSIDDDIKRFSVYSIRELELGKQYDLRMPLRRDIVGNDVLDGDICIDEYYE